MRRARSWHDELFLVGQRFLTGKYRTEDDLAKSAVRGEGVRHYLNPRGLRILDALDAISRRHDATPAQIALAWLMAHPSVTAPIASATNLAQLKDLAASTQIKLWEDDYSELNTASAPNQDS
jgi:aryl-alcohol dehydrogenase-like predicted oxidoreductase